MYHHDDLLNGGRERKREREQEQHEEFDGHEYEHEGEREQLTHLADGQGTEKDCSLDSFNNSKLFPFGTPPQQQQQQNPRSQDSLGGTLTQDGVDTLSATAVAGSNDDTRVSGTRQDDADDAKRRQGRNRVACGEERSSVDHSSNGCIGEPGSRHYEIDEGAGDEEEEGEVVKCLQLTVETETLLRMGKKEGRRGGGRGPSDGIGNGGEGGKESGPILSVPTCKWSPVSAVGVGALKSSSSHANTSLDGSMTFSSPCTTSSSATTPTFLCGGGGNGSEIGLNGNKDAAMKRTSVAVSKGTTHPGTSGTSSFPSSPGGTSFSSAVSGLSGGSGGAQANFGNLFLGHSSLTSSSSNGQQQQVQGNAMDMEVDERVEGSEEEREGEGTEGNIVREVNRNPPTSTRNSNNTTNNSRTQQQQQQSVQRGDVPRPMDSTHHYSNTKKRFGGDTPATPHDNHSDTPLAVVSLPTSSSTSMLSRTPTLDRFESVQGGNQEGQEETEGDEGTIVVVQKKQGTNKRRAMTR